MIIFGSRNLYKMIIGMLSICIISLSGITIYLNSHINEVYEYCYSQEQTVQMLEQEIIKQSNVIEKAKQTEEELIREAEVYQKEKDFYQKASKLLQTSKNKKEWFVSYKELLSEYSQWIESPTTIEDEYKPDDIYLLQRVVETETYNCNFESKVNVACVIFNRIKSKKFPDDLKKNIINTNQFVYGRTNISEDTKIAVEYAYMMGDTTNGALYFHSGKKTEYFNGAKFIFEDSAGHYFYK